MQVKELSEKEYGKYSALVSEYGSIFNSLEWLSLFDGTKLFGIYDNGDKLIGGFHLCFEKRAGMNFIRNAPYTPFIGLVLKNDSKNKSNYQSFEKRVFTQLADFFEQLPWQVISASFHFSHIDMQPFIWKKFKVIPNYTYLIGLSESADVLKSMMASERRNDIAKAVKDGVEVRQEEDLKVVRELILNTFNRKQKSVNKSYIDKILFDFAESKNSFAFVSYKENIPLAASFCLHDKHNAYYLLGGYDSLQKHHGAGACAVWEAIQHAQKLGLKHFDMEGSMIKNVESYFRGFGGKLTPYFTVNKATVPFEIVLKFIKREMF